MQVHLLVSFAILPLCHSLSYKETCSAEDAQICGRCTNIGCVDLKNNFIGSFTNVSSVDECHELNGAPGEMNTWMIATIWPILATTDIHMKILVTFFLHVRKKLKALVVLLKQRTATGHQHQKSPLQKLPYLQHKPLLQLLPLIIQLPQHQQQQPQSLALCNSMVHK